MKDTKRALRRFHDRRIYLRSKKLQIQLRSWFFDDKTGYDFQEKQLNNVIKRIHNNFTMCSCSMCCNPRRQPFLSRKERRTMPERKELARFKYEMLEIINNNKDDL